MTINHIDQLAQWWETAERGTARKGDRVILRHEDGSYEVHPDAIGEDREYVRIRILSRAPQPKPAWHDALAVMARCSNAPEGHREPFIRSDATHDVWVGEAGRARTEDLRDVTPLAEAKVTDEMVLRALNASAGLDLSHLTAFKRNEVEDMRFALSAALGIEAE